MPTLPARDPFPPLSKRLAERYAYLTEGFIRYRGPGPLEDLRLAGLFEGERSLFALLAENDAAVPYPARFAGLRRAENRRLTGQTDLFVCQAWPQPSVNVAFGRAQRERRRRRGASPATGHIVGQDRPTEPTDVMLKRVGSAQLWWPQAAFEGAECSPEEPSEETRRPAPAVIWEAFLDLRKPPLLAWLWDGCEAFVAERGAGRVLTPARDPAYDPAAYRQFLMGRGYVPVQSTGQEAPMPWLEKRL